MSTITHDAAQVTGGVDTHKDTHTAAVLDAAGRPLGAEQFPATGAGYRALLAWLRSFGELVLVGVQGTGAYGAGLARYLRTHAVQVVEIDRPDRKTRRRQGKCDPVDAQAAARAALAGRRVGTPKHRDGKLEALRTLRVARCAAIAQRATTPRQIKDLIVTAPEPVRVRLRALPDRALLAACAALRPDERRAGDPRTAVKISLRSLARRHRALTAQIIELDRVIDPLVEAINPALLRVHGIGPDLAAQLLATVGDNPARMRSEAAFAMLCGVAPLPASSGNTNRHA